MSIGYDPIVIRKLYSIFYMYQERSLFLPLFQYKLYTYRFEIDKTCVVGLKLMLVILKILLMQCKRNYRDDSYDDNLSFLWLYQKCINVLCIFRSKVQEFLGNSLKYVALHNILNPNLLRVSVNLFKLLQ